MHSLRRLLLIGILSVVARPRLALLISTLVLTLSAVLAANRLNISTDQNKLFDPNVSFFRDYLAFNAKFPENEAIYVIVEPRDPKHVPPVHEWTAIADSIARHVRKLHQYVRSVDAKIPVNKLGAQGLLFDEPAGVKKNFVDARRFLPLAKLWTEKPGILTRLLGSTPLERFLSALQTQPATDETAGFVAPVARSWNATLAGDSPLRIGKELPDLADVGASTPLQLGYYFQDDDSDPTHQRKLLLVRIYNREDYTSLTAISEAVEAIRREVRSAAKPFKQFTTGVTGRPALDADEMRTTDRDSSRAEILAVIAVFIGLVVMLRSIWLALAGEIALGFGVGWTFGWATISVGELNLLSIVFLLALIGIGMDYLVQILTRYRQEAARRATPRTIWISIFHHVAAPINTACLGASGAFLVSVLTRFRGAAQLGIIAGGGLLLCLTAGYVVLPALLTLFPPKFARETAVRDLGPVAKGSRWLLLLPVIWIALMIAGVPLAMRTSFDSDLLNLQPPKLESVKLVKKLQTWSAVVLSHDLKTLRLARDAVNHSPLVSHTDSILTAYDNLDWLRAHQGELPELNPVKPTSIETNDLATIARKAKSLADHFSKADKPATTHPAATQPDERRAAADALEKFSQTINLSASTKPTYVANRLSAWQNAFVDELVDLLKPFHPKSLDTTALPIELKSHYVSADGTYALYIYPSKDLWVHANLAAFVQDVEKRVKPVPGDRTLTGIAINIFHSTSSIEKSFYKAAIYALALIFILVLVDLRRIGSTLMAISVLALGLPMLVALMGLFNQSWNFANFFGLPILIGAGHEYGVFMVHRYREGVRDPRRVWRRWDVSDRALLLCAYVTCTSFGFFWILAHHRGLKSLGLVMALGTACIYLAAVCALRPFLLWRLAVRRRRTDGETP